MIKVGSIVRDINRDKIGLLVDVALSDTGRGVMGYIVLIDNRRIYVPIGFLEVVYGEQTCTIQI